MGFLEKKKAISVEQKACKTVKDVQITERVDIHTFFMGEESSLSKTVFFHIYNWRTVMI